MSGSNISKIERVYAPQSNNLWVDLCLNKSSGLFFADVGGERITDATKAAVVEQVRVRLGKLAQTDWRPVILLRVKKVVDDDDRVSHENDRQVFYASCSFTYARRERSTNPLKPKERIEREHTLEFEARVHEARERATRSEHDRSKKAKKADDAEQALRDRRAALSDIGSQWTSFNDDVQELELPYTPEAWAGIERISRTLRETQTRLDELARGASTETLAQLAAGGGGDVFKMLPAPSRRPKGDS